MLTALSDTDHSLLLANCKADNTRKKAVIARRQIEMRAKSLLQVDIALAMYVTSPQVVNMCLI